MQRVFAYLWASPGTFIGFLFVPLAVIRNGKAVWIDGVLEVHGGFVTSILMRGNRWVGPIAAITLGHVVLGQNSKLLEETRAHERVHVRQYERWGPFFIPAYFLASIYVGLKGFHPYLDNPFEIEAYDASDPFDKRSAK